MRLGALVRVDKSEGRYRSWRLRRRYTAAEIEQLLAADAERHRTRRYNAATPVASDHARRRAAEYEAQLISEGNPPAIAWARARAAYGLERDVAPEGHPEFSPDRRREFLDRAASSRRCP
jgi:hypothetical protein